MLIRLAFIAVERISVGCRNFQRLRFHTIEAYTTQSRLHCPSLNTTKKAVMNDSDAVQFYRKNGYLQLPRFFTRVETTALRSALDKVIAGNRPRLIGQDREHSEGFTRVFKQLINLWVDHPEIRKFTHDPRLAEIARDLSEAGHVSLYHDQALIKSGGEHSRATNWHQDAPYYPMEQPGALSAWIAVDDVTEENGCMQFIPGSHAYGRLESVPFDIEGASVLENVVANGDVIEEDPVVMEMEAGGVTFHHGCTFHYASPNRTEDPRRAFTVIYVPDYVTYDGNWAAGGSDDLEIGKPFKGKHYPVLATA